MLARKLIRHIDAGRLPAAERHVKRRVSRANAEALALQLPSSRVALNLDTSYWIGATGAAAILGVKVSRLNQLVAAGRVPFEVHADGRRMYHRSHPVAGARYRPAHRPSTSIKWVSISTMIRGASLTTRLDHGRARSP